MRYGSLRRELEAVISSSKDDSIEAETIQAIREKLDSISNEAPEIPDRIWNRTENLLENRP